MTVKTSSVKLSILADGLDQFSGVRHRQRIHEPTVFLNVYNVQPCPPAPLAAIVRVEGKLLLFGFAEALLLDAANDDPANDDSGHRRCGQIS